MATLVQQHTQVVQPLANWARRLHALLQSADGLGQARLQLYAAPVAYAVTAQPGFQQRHLLCFERRRVLQPVEHGVARGIPGHGP